MRFLKSAATRRDAYLKDTTGMRRSGNAIAPTLTKIKRLA